MVLQYLSQCVKFDVQNSGSPPPKDVFTPIKKLPGFVAVYTGPIQEQPQHYLLLIVWESSQAYHAFLDSSAEYTKLLSYLRTLSHSSPTQFTIDFGNVIFWPSIGANTELQTVYFSFGTTSEFRLKLRALNGLIMPIRYGIGGEMRHMYPYRKVPVCGWVMETQEYRGQEVDLCVWMNSWTSKERETEFKQNTRHLPKDGTDERPLVFEVWERELADLGALGSSSIHVDFEFS